MFRDIFFLLLGFFSVVGICCAPLIPKFMDEEQEAQQENDKEEENEKLFYHFKEITSLEEIPWTLRGYLSFSSKEEEKKGN